MNNPSGIPYNEYYLYSEKAWEMAPVGETIHILASGVLQNAPIVITSSGYETTRPEDPWAQTAGLRKYVKRGWGYFTTLFDGSYDVSRNEFALDPSASGRIIFNKPLTENVYIEYESGLRGYYVLDSLDVNPIRYEFDGGFLHHSRITDVTHLYLMATQGTLYADGFDNAKLVASIFDSDFDRVPDKEIVFEIDTVDGWSELGYFQPIDGSVTRIDPSGFPVEVTAITDNRGEAKVRYVTRERKAGIQWFTATHKNTDDPSYINVRDDCVAQYRLNDDRNNYEVHDGSLNGHMGTANKETIYLSHGDGVITEYEEGELIYQSRCFSFDGASDYIYAAAAIDAPKGFYCWIYPDAYVSSGVQYHIVFTKHDGADQGIFLDYVSSPNKIVVAFKNVGGTIRRAEYSIPDYNCWYFIVGQLENQWVRLYINNVLQDENSFPTDYTLEDTSTYPFLIGGGVTNRYSKCRIDTCASFNRFLTGKEREWLWNSGHGREKLWLPGSIYDRATIAQYYLTSEPFTLDISLLDTLDYLT